MTSELARGGEPGRWPRVPSPGGLPLGRWARTVARLRPGQVIHRLRSRIRLAAERQLGSRLADRYAPPEDLEGRLLAWEATPGGESRVRPGYDCRLPELAAGVFRHLGVGRDLGMPPRDWLPEDPAISRLWLFQLHYLECLDELAAPEAPEGAAARLLESWIDANAPGGRGWWVAPWHPFVVATRIQSLTRTLHGIRRHRGGNSLPSGLRDSLYVHGAFLARHVEYDLLGNHLVRNLVGLLLAGRGLAATPTGKAWLLRGARELHEALERQVLTDGGHEERTPMYHALVLQDLLDAVEGLPADPGQLPDLGAGEAGELADRRRGLVDLGRRMHRWLATMCHTDDDIPLFNDSVLLGDSLGALLDRGGRILGEVPEPDSGSVGLPESGYFWLRTPGAACVIDCGPIAAADQPAHGHCDMLSYELTVDGRRLIADTGVYEYREGPARDWVRSTRAHNTLAVEGLEQSEMWKSFRVGRRARPVEARLESDSTGAVFRGAHDGYRPAGLVHRRRVRLSAGSGGRVLEVEDQAAGRSDRKVSSVIQLAPGIGVSARGGELDLAPESGPALGTLVPGAGIDVEITTCPYCPAFGTRIERPRIELRGRAGTPLGYAIHLRENR